jgi:hypothetical protein
MRALHNTETHGPGLGRLRCGSSDHDGLRAQELSVDQSPQRWWLLVPAFPGIDFRFMHAAARAS